MTPAPVGTAGLPQFFQPGFALLLAVGSFGRFVATETEEVTRDDNVDVLGKTLDQLPSFRERCPALESRTMSGIRSTCTRDIRCRRAGIAVGAIGMLDSASAVEPTPSGKPSAAGEGCHKKFLPSPAGSRRGLLASPSHDRRSCSVIRSFPVRTRQQAQDGVCGVVFSSDGSRAAIVVSIVW
jgi:hypothetical protein